MGNTLKPAPPLLEVRNLKTHFPTKAGTVKAVDGVSFHITAGGRLGIVGESGSGKSVTSLSIMRLIDRPGRIVEGEILLKGRDVTTLREREMRELRGRELSLVFQDPMSALNPVYTAGAQVIEALRAHRTLSNSEARERAIQLFRMVGISAPERRVDEFPHKLSGGMRQRVTIAMALANEPELLILDEPTTALDVTIQAQILDIVRGLKRATVLLISHDIGVVREICDEVVVMYGGRVMEWGQVDQVTRAPKHPYTRGLLSSIPNPEMRGNPLPTIGGAVPNLLDMPRGCPFRPRCKQATRKCMEMPPLESKPDNSKVACWLA
ncbi:ABC transporter ATP-binding protein [Bradyrhizobium sp. CIR3A]|uniref:ABC transporter ATP-binding protein n=1 Tax=Bradyrhizobium sp. CIR3A TaxID=2663838 RepID=UPI001606AE79|nr:ABC transporter ATP-binding protein [Bradyrhizobium sp. CIR3A]MBB4264224.1 oligopeptide/dipeptide ABC transporter ATP-binding protein [Bradyrhizobium sp. CIR3A]